MKAKIKVLAAKRLAAYVSPNAQALIDRVESVLTPHGIRRVDRPFPNPREYRKKAPEMLLNQVQEDLEKLGFKFRKLDRYTMNTKAVESDGTFQSVNYILDLVFNYDRLEVDLYY